MLLFVIAFIATYFEHVRAQLRQQTAAVILLASFYRYFHYFYMSKGRFLNGEIIQPLTGAFAIS